jgi:hypothetical protein
VTFVLEADAAEAIVAGCAFVAVLKVAGVVAALAAY